MRSPVKTPGLVSKTDVHVRSASYMLAAHAAVHRSFWQISKALSHKQKMLRRLLHVAQVMLTMDKVQAAILDWDYFDVVKGGVASMQMMKPVPKIFGSAAAYAETFKCLLLEELRASAQQVCIFRMAAAQLACNAPLGHPLSIVLGTHCVWMAGNAPFCNWWTAEAV